MVRHLPDVILAVFLLALLPGCHPAPDTTEVNYVSYRADPKRQALRLYWRDAQGHRFGSLGQLGRSLADHGDSLIFAMNGGMFNPTLAPQGLYIEDGRELAPLDTSSGAGNFYLKPNGVFYLTATGAAGICPTAAWPPAGRVQFATQSGPLLVLAGQVHPAFRPGSANVQIRNGVGLLPDGRVLLAMSKTKVNFYDFADYFRRAGCRTALYLDGFVSRTYAPATGWQQLDGDFGVIVAISARGAN